MWENLGFQTQLGPRDEMASGICCFPLPRASTWLSDTPSHMLPVLVWAAV